MPSTDLKRAGLKTTVPRLRVLDLLEQNRDQHMSAEDIYRALIDLGVDVGIATVYRVLTQFESADLVIRHNFDDGRAVYELDDGTHHDHIVCIDCGAVSEFLDDTIERRQRSVAKELGFELHDHSMVLYGHCTKPRCPARRKVTR